MKVSRKSRIELFDVDFQMKAQIQSVVRFFQDISTHHSTVVGVGPQVLLDKGVVWFLNRLEIEFFRYPELYENIETITWSRGFKRFKGYREYLMTSEKGEIARGTSIWIFFDVKRNRIARIPSDITERYGIEKEHWFETEIDEWKTCGAIEPEQDIDITMRYSDFDINGHVNNTIYFGFLETLYYQTIQNGMTPVRNIKIRYNQEIERGIRKIKAGWRKENNVYHFNLSDGDALFADGEITPMDD